MNDDECRNIERRAVLHLVKCMWDDMSLGMDELSSHFSLVVSSLSKLEGRK